MTMHSTGVADTIASIEDDPNIEKNKIVIRGLPNQIDDRGLRSLIEGVAEPLNIERIPGRRVAFLTFKNFKDADRCIRELNGTPPYNLNAEFFRQKVAYSADEGTCSLKNFTEKGPQKPPPKRQPEFVRRRQLLLQDLRYRDNQRLPGIEILEPLLPRKFGCRTVTSGRGHYTNHDGVTWKGIALDENWEPTNEQSAEKPCLHCARETAEFCRDCFSAYCSYECMRLDSTVHSTYCNKLISGGNPPPIREAPPLNYHEQIERRYRNVNADRNINEFFRKSNFSSNCSNHSGGEISLKESFEATNLKTRFNLDSWKAPGNSFVKHTTTHRGNVDCHRGKDVKPLMQKRILMMEEVQMKKTNEFQKDCKREGRNSGKDIPHKNKKSGFVPKTNRNFDRSKAGIALDPDDSIISSKSETIHEIKKTGDIETPINHIPYEEKSSFMAVTCMFKENDGYWVLPESKISEWEDLHSALNKETRRGGITPAVNAMYLAPYENQLYRVRVKSLKPRLEVHYIDYGNSDVADVGKLISLPAEFRRWPPMVFFVRFTPETPDEIKEQNWQDKLLNIRCIKEEGLVKIVEVDKKPEVEKRKQAKVVPIVCNWAFDLLSVATIGTCVFVGNCGNGLFRTAIVPESSQKECYDTLNMKYDKTQLNVAQDYSELVLVDLSQIKISSLSSNFARGRVLKKSHDLLNVALVDYGLLCSVKEVYELKNKQLAPAPKMACIMNMLEVMAWNEIGPQETLRFRVTAKVEDRFLLEILSQKSDKTVARAIAEKWDPLSDKINQGVLSSGELVVVEFFQGISLLYLSSKSHENIYNKLISDVGVLCVEGSPLSEPPVVGSIVGGLFEHDSTYYRGIVLSANDKEANVRFLDFGNQQLTPLKNLRELPSNLQNVAPGVVLVKLKNVPAVTAEGAVVLLNKLISSRKELILKYDDDISQGVHLFYKSDGASLNEQLVEKSKINYTASAAPVSDAVRNPDICTITKLPVNCSFTLVLTFVDSSDFGTVFGFSAEDKVALHVSCEMFEAMEKYCKAIPPTPYRPHKGEICAALFDEQWARALYISDAGPSSVRVLFIDYGNKEIIETHHVRPLASEFKKYPGIATSCRIKGFNRARTEKEKKSLLDKLNEMVETPCKDVRGEEVLLNGNEYFEVTIHAIEGYLKNLQLK